jgi:hypothetical protein
VSLSEPRGGGCSVGLTGINKNTNCCLGVVVRISWSIGLHTRRTTRQAWYFGRAVEVSVSR